MITINGTRRNGRGSHECGVLAEMSRSEVEVLRRHADVVTAAPGQKLQVAGGLPRWFHCILGGIAVVERDGRVTDVGPGFCFPAEVLRGDTSHTDASITAVTPVRVISMGVREFKGALDTLPGFAAAVQRLAPDAAHLALSEV